MVYNFETGRRESPELRKHSTNQLMQMQDLIDGELQSREIKERNLARNRPNNYNGYRGKAEQDETTSALMNWMRKGGDVNAIQPRERELIDYNRMNLNNYDAEEKAMISASSDLGGFWAGSDMSTRLIQKLFLTTPIRQYADVQTISGQVLIMPSEGSTDTSVAWTDEQNSYGLQPDATVGLVEVWAREISGYLKVSKTMLEDQAFDLEGFVMGRLTRQFALKQGQAFLSGNGVARPEGILTAVTAGRIPAAQVYTCSDSTNHTIGPQDITNLIHKVKSQYRSRGVFLANNQTIGALRLFEDTVARPIWQNFGDSYQETLLGIPLIEAPDLVAPTGTFTSTGTHPGGQAKFAANDQPIIFASLKDGYQIVDRVGVTFQRLSELFAIQNQVAFLARARVGGAVVLPEAYAILKIA